MDDAVLCGHSSWKSQMNLAKLSASPNTSLQERLMRNSNTTGDP